MSTNTTDKINEIKTQITEQLGLSHVPVNLTPEQTSTILNTSVNTLSVWRSTGRYNLPYVKLSRRVAYPLSSVSEFLLKRTINHTSDNIID